MLRLLVRAITISGDSSNRLPAIGVYPGKRRRDICIRARHPRDERSITQRSPNRTEENRTSGFESPRESAFFSTTTRAASWEKKRREAKRGRNAMTRSPDRPSEIDASSIYTPTTRSQNLSYSTITVHDEKKGIQATSASRVVRHKVENASHRTPQQLASRPEDVRHARLLSLHHAFSR